MTIRTQGTLRLTQHLKFFISKSFNKNTSWIKLAMMLSITQCKRWTRQLAWADHTRGIVHKSKCEEWFPSGRGQDEHLNTSMRTSLTDILTAYCWLWNPLENRGKSISASDQKQKWQLFGGDGCLQLQHSAHADGYFYFVAQVPNAIGESWL